MMSDTTHAITTTTTTSSSSAFLHPSSNKSRRLIAVIALVVCSVLLIKFALLATPRAASTTSAPAVQAADPTASASLLVVGFDSARVERAKKKTSASPSSSSSSSAIRVSAVNGKLPPEQQRSRRQAVVAYSKKAEWERNFVRDDLLSFFDVTSVSDFDPKAGKWTFDEFDESIEMEKRFLRRRRRRRGSSSARGTNNSATNVTVQLQQQKENARRCTPAHFDSRLKSLLLADGGTEKEEDGSYSNNPKNNNNSDSSSPSSSASSSPPFKVRILVTQTRRNTISISVLEKMIQLTKPHVCIALSDEAGDGGYLTNVLRQAAASSPSPGGRGGGFCKLIFKQYYHHIVSDDPNTRMYQIPLGYVGGGFRNKGAPTRIETDQDPAMSNVDDIFKKVRKWYPLFSRPYYVDHHYTGGDEGGDNNQRNEDSFTQRNGLEIADPRVNDNIRSSRRVRIRELKPWVEPPQSSPTRTTTTTILTSTTTTTAATTTSAAGGVEETATSRAARPMPKSAQPLPSSLAPMTTISAQQQKSDEQQQQSKSEDDVAEQNLLAFDFDDDGPVPRASRRAWDWAWSGTFKTDRKYMISSFLQLWPNSYFLRSTSHRAPPPPPPPPPLASSSQQEQQQQQPHKKESPHRNSSNSSTGGAVVFVDVVEPIGRREGLFLPSDAQMLPRSAIAAFRNAAFVPIGQGWIRYDAMRIYESLKIGAIPIIVSPDFGKLLDEFSNLIGSDSPREKNRKMPDGIGICSTSWHEAIGMAMRLSMDPAALDAQQRRCVRFWNLMMTKVRERLAAMTDYVDGKNCDLSLV